MPPEEDEPMEMKVRRDEVNRPVEKSETPIREGRVISHFQVNTRDHAKPTTPKPTGSSGTKGGDKKK